MALMSTFQKEHAATTKKLMLEIANLKNKVQQLQQNLKKQSSSPNPKNNPSKQLPFKDYTPTDPNKIKLWKGIPYFYCKHCNRGDGCWTKSHSTNGDPSNNVSAHRGKRFHNDQQDRPNKKPRISAAIPASLQAALAENSESAQLLAAYIESARAGK